MKWQPWLTSLQSRFLRRSIPARRSQRLGFQTARSRGTSASLGVERLEDRLLPAIVTWDGGAGTQSWNDPANWSNDLLPDIGDDVQINAGAETTITLSSGDHTIQSLYSTSPFTFSGGTLAVATTMKVDAALQVQGGTLSGANLLAGAAGSSIVVSSSTFDGVTLSGNAEIQQHGMLSVRNGLTLNGEIKLLGGSSHTSVYFYDTQTLAGTGQVTFADYGRLYVATEDSTLTIGSNITIAGVGGQIYGASDTSQIINNGAIRSNGGGNITINPHVWTNHGTLEANGGALYLSGTWSNTGTINAHAGTTYLSGTINGLGTLLYDGGTVSLNGTLDNTGKTLALNSATGDILFGGTILGGTITTTNGAKLIAQGGTFDGVTLSGNAEIQQHGMLSVRNGLTLNGEIKLLGGSSHTSVYFYDTQTLAGTGQVTFADYGRLYVATEDTTLTIGSNITIAGVGGQIYGASDTSQIINNGAIRSNGGGNITINPHVWTNHGTLEANGGALYLGGTTWSNDGTISITTDHSLQLQGTWSNTGTINAHAGVTYLSGTINGLGTLLYDGGTVSLNGQLDNTGKTLTLNAATGDILFGGTILGGTITTADGAKLIAYSGTFDGVTLSGNAEIQQHGTLSVRNGLTLNGEIKLLGGSSHTSVYFYDTQTLAGTGQVTFADYGRLYVATEDTTLTIGSNITIAGVGGQIYGASDTSQIINNGAIRSNGGGNITINPHVWTNHGTLEANGGALYLGGTTWSNDGTISITTDHSLQLQGTWSNTGTINAHAGTTYLSGTINNLGTLQHDGGTVSLNGTLDNTGKTLTLNAATGDILFGGTILGGTITTADGAKLIAYSGTFDGVTLSGNAEIQQNGILSVRNGLTLNGELKLLGGSGHTSVYFYDTQTLAGTGQVTFADYGRLYVATEDTTLTIGSNITIAGVGGQIYAATDNSQIINHGTIRSLTGVTWHDLNRNGVRDRDSETGAFTEPVLSNWTIYLDRDGDNHLDGNEDLNGNELLDNGEDVDGDTRLDFAEQFQVSDANGEYTFVNITSIYQLREVPQAGWAASAGDRNAYVPIGSVATTDFGNYLLTAGSVSGVKYNDHNGSGGRDSHYDYGLGQYIFDDEGLSDWVIYADINGNHRLDVGEPFALTESDNPMTEENEAGRYSITGIPAGISTVIRETLTGGRQDELFDWFRSTPEPNLYIYEGYAYTGYDFGNYQPDQTNAIYGTTWHDHNGNGYRDQGTIAPSNLMAWYQAEYSTDDAVNLNDATLVNGAYFTSGKIGSGFSFDGVDDAVQVASPVNLPIGNSSRTMSVWFRTPLDVVAAGETAIVQYGSVSNNSMFALITSVNAPGKLSFFGYNNDLPGTTTLLPETWYHAAVTYDVNTLSLYLNGELEAQKTTADLNTILDSNGLLIGYRPDINAKWTGQIDEVQIYDRALTGGEIATLHADEENGIRPYVNRDEALAGWTIYVDANNDGDRDNGELSAVTDATGGYELVGLLAGYHNVREVPQAGWNSSIAHHHVYLYNHEQRELDFANYEPVPSLISGVKWNDLDSNGSRADYEPLLSGWTIYLDLNNNFQLDTSEDFDGNGMLDPGEDLDSDGLLDLVMAEPSMVTNANGYYELLTPGGTRSFSVRELSQAGWTATRGDRGLYLYNGIPIPNEDFGNFTPAADTTISGTKWNDLDHDGVRDDDEPVLPGWHFFIDTDSSNSLTPADIQATTDSNGHYTLTGVPTGYNYVREVQPIGWHASRGDRYVYVYAVGATVLREDFGNYFIDPETGEIHGRKWHDLNGNGVRDVIVGAAESTIVGSTDDVGGLNPDFVDVYVAPNDPISFTVTFTVPEASGDNPLLDIVLLQDLSGSFGDDVPTVAAAVPGLITGVQALQADAQFAVASFVDKPGYGFGSGSDYVYRTDLALTDNAANIQNAVTNLAVLNGNDTPESQIEALMQLAVRTTEIGFRPDSRRVVVLMTDADYHRAGDAPDLLPENDGDAELEGMPPGTGEDYPSVAQVRTALLNAGIIPVFAVTSGVVSVYQDLVNQLGFGSVVTLTSNSSNIVDAVTEGVSNALRDVTLVTVGDDYQYVESITPVVHQDVPPGESRSFTVTLRVDNGRPEDTFTLRAFGLGETTVHVTSGQLEPGLAGWTIYLDTDGDGERDPGEPSTETTADNPLTVTDELGEYSFTGLPIGDLIVRENKQPFWSQTYPSLEAGGFHDVVLGIAEIATERNFGNFVPGSIHGYKFEDINGDGVEAETDLRLPGVTVTLTSDLNGDSILETQTLITNANGEYAFRNLLPGIYTVTETVPEGSQATRPTSFRVTVQSRQEFVAYIGQARLAEGDPRVEVLVGDADEDGYRDLIFANHVTSVPMAFVAIADSNAVKPEGSSGSISFTFTVTRTGEVSDSTSVDYAITGSGDHSADAADFGGTLPAGAVTFASGETSKTITINVTGDTTIENDEGFTVTLSNPSNGTTIVTAAASGVILNDDFSNTAPTDLALPNGYVMENSPVGTLVDYFGTADEDANETFSYSLISGDGDADNGAFTISGNQLLTNAVFDFETRSGYRIRVRSTDSGGESIEKAFTVGVMNANEGAAAGSGIQAVTVVSPEIAPPDSASGGDFAQKPSVSADGRYVAFASYGNNLVPGDTNAAQDIFVRDLQTGTTTRVSIGPNGEQANDSSYSASISADGRFVTFDSSANNLVEGDTNDSTDVFVRDLLLGTTTRVSVTNHGGQANYASDSGIISSTGGAVAFISYATDLAGDENGGLFVRDIETATTTRILPFSATHVFFHNLSFSADGTRLAFESGTGPNRDVFVFDRTTSVLTVASIGFDGSTADARSDEPALSADGRFVVFYSDASNLVDGDTSTRSGVFIRDLNLQTTSRVTNDPGLTDSPTVSADGRYVAYRHAGAGYFVRDRLLGTTIPASVSTAGDVAVSTDNRAVPVITPDGRFVVFAHLGSSLVPQDTNKMVDVFIRDLHTETTGLVSRRDPSLATVTASGSLSDGTASVSTDGQRVLFASSSNNLVPSQQGQAAGSQYETSIYLRDFSGPQPTTTLVMPMAHTPWLSGNGQFALFFSYDSSLVPNDTNGDRDLFRMNLETSEVIRVNVANDGSQANGDSWAYIMTSPISADGRFVVFSSTANNLVTGDSNGQRDLFVRDLDLGTTTRINVSSAGTQANGESYSPSISADGRYVVFVSEASNLVANDTNGTKDIFLHDMATGITTLVSLSSSEIQGDSSSNSPVISANGRFVAFTSSARNLTEQSQSQGIYVRDLVAGTTTLVSVTLNGSGTFDYSQSPSISDDGRFVAFRSNSRNLVSGDTNEQMDVFVRDMRRGETTRLSVSEAGVQGNQGSDKPVISGDGKHVVFVSYADNLVANDFNNFGDIFLVPFVASPFDETPILVQSITRVGNSVTNAATVEFTVTFSEPITGLTTDDFALDVAGLSDASIADIIGSGDTYTVTVHSGTGDGPLSIDFTGTVTDAAGFHSEKTFTAGDSITIDKTPPTVTSIIRQSEFGNQPQEIDFVGATENSPPRLLIDVHGTLFFVNGGDQMVWKSDGTANGTLPVKEDGPIIWEGNGMPMVNMNGTLFFIATDITHGYELWKTDGTTSGTVLVKDIQPGSGPSYNYSSYFDRGPRWLSNVNGTLYFSANDGTHGYELWKSDGTEAGTVMVKDIAPGTASSHPFEMTNVDGTLYFNANDGTHGVGLWTSDGTMDGTVLVNEYNKDSALHYPTELGGKLFFIDEDENGYSSLWTIEENGPEVVVSDLQLHSGMTNVAGTLFFAARQTSSDPHGFELWKSDGTAEGTALLADLVPGSESSVPSDFTNVNGTVFFRFQGGGFGYSGLGKTDGTTNGTVVLLDLDEEIVNLGELTNTNGTLFFRKDTSGSGVELWTSDGSAAGTMLVADLNPSGDSYPSSLTSVGQRLFLVANDGESQKLWVLDTAAQEAEANNDNVEFTVTFSETVTGVGIEDFAIDVVGLMGAAITGVSGSGMTYTVTVSTGQGSGTVSIDFVGTVNDLANNLSEESFTDGEVVTIVRPEISVGVAPGQVLEDGGTNLVYTLTRTGPTDAELTIHFDVSGTATFSTDYSQVGAATFSATSGTVTFAAGSSTATVTIAPTSDGLIEANESVVLTVIAGSEYLLSETIQATGTISNDDSASFAITNASATEGSGVTFTITLSNAVDVDTSVSFSTSNGSATISDGDYAAVTAQTVVFAAGTTSKTVTVNTTTDNKVEADETFSATLSGLNDGGRSVTIATATATGTITNDDSASFAITNASATEGSGVTFTITLSNAVDVETSVTFATSNGSATTSDGDYTAVTVQTVVFAAGTTSRTVTVNTSSDSKVEANENFTATLSGLNDGGRSVTIATATATGTITNDDSASFAITNASATEGSGVTFTITLSNAVDVDTSVTFSTSNGTATTADSDYSAITSQAVLFTAGTTSKTVTVNTTTDNKVEADETFTATLSGPNNGGRSVTIATTSATGTITNDDVAGFTITQTTGVLSVSEDGSTAQFTVRLTAQPTSNVVLTLVSSDTTEATVGPTTLTFTPSNWDVAQTVTVTGVEDTELDGAVASTITVRVNAAASDDAFDAVTNKTVSVSTSDNDFFGFRILESGGSTTVGESGSTDTFTVVLAAQPTSNVVLNLTSSDTGEATVTPATLTFTSSNWNRPQTVTVKGINDDFVDGSQVSNVTIRVNAASSENRFDAFPAQVVSVTTTDNDVAGFRITETSGSTSVNEGGTTDTFTVVLTARPLTNVVLSLSSSDTGEATATPTTLTFTTSNWNTAQTVTVRGVNDDLIDGDQVSLITVRVNDASSDNFFDHLADQTVSVTTADNDLSDFGDAPDSYGTTLPNGARHLISATGPKLGTLWDGETNGQPSSGATADGADEDGVFFATDLFRRASAVTSGAVFVTASKAAKLDAWIDFNRDGDFLDPGERILATRSVTAGLNRIPLTVPSTAVVGDTFARFRISTAGTASPIGAAADGEVEDYRLTIADGDLVRPLTINLPNDGLPLNVSVSQTGFLEVLSGTAFLVQLPVSRVSSLQINGGDGSDRMTVSALPSSLNGQVTLDGGGGADVINGSAAAVRLRLLGGGGNDTLQGSDLDDSLFGESGNDSIEGNRGDDIILGGTGNDRLFGEDGNDALVGDDGNDSLEGGAGRDTLFGLAGNDTLLGGDDTDTLMGGTDDDSMNGGAGTDKFNGGGGNDRYVLGEAAERNLSQLFTFDLQDILDRI